MNASPNDLAITLTGGGARAAYQVGILRYLARIDPDLKTPVLTGVSAGAINAAYLAGQPGSFAQRVEDLSELWNSLSVEDVFRVDGFSLFTHMLRWAFRLTIGGSSEGKPRVQGFVDTTPLEKTLRRALNLEYGKLTGIQRNLRAELLRAVALVTTNYATGQTVSWVQGRKVQTWERPMRRAVDTSLSISHVMASAALPLFFPAVPIGNDYYGDGGIRLAAPLAPAIHLQAGRILAISNRYVRTQQEAEQREVAGYPPPAQVLNVLIRAVFLDVLDQDATHCERLNRLLEKLPAEEHEGLRRVRLCVIRPSRDLGALANEFEPRLPGLFRFLTRRLGTKRMRSQDLISLVMFQSDYVRRLMDLGEEDAEARGDELREFLADG